MTQNSLTLIRPLLQEVASYASGGRRYSADGTVSQALPLLERVVRAGMDSSLSAFKPEGAPFVQHYTSMPAVVHMLKQVARARRHESQQDQQAVENNHPAFRMYHTEGFNDPSEGTIMSHLQEKYRWLKISNEHGKDVYACSFAVPEEDTTNRAQSGMADNLMFWRLYGHDGMGCSIRTSSQHFAATGKFLQVRYWGEGKEIEPWLSDILSLMDKIVSSHGNAAERFSGMLVSALEDYRYFIKSQHYEHEREYRAIHTPEDNEGVKFDTKGFPHIRRYINGGPKLKDIFVSSTVITVGPQVRAPYAVKAYIEKLLKSAQLEGPRVKVSRIKYKTT